MKVAERTAARRLLSCKSPALLRLELFGTGPCASVRLIRGLPKLIFFPGAFQGRCRARGQGLRRQRFPLLAEDIAEILVWVASRPTACVALTKMLIKATDQSAMHKVLPGEKNLG